MHPSCISLLSTELSLPQASGQECPGQNNHLTLHTNIFTSLRAMPPRQQTESKMFLARVPYCGAATKVHHRGTTVPAPDVTSCYHAHLLTPFPLTRYRHTFQIHTRHMSPLPKLRSLRHSINGPECPGQSNHLQLHT